MSIDENGLSLLQTIIGPWYESLKNPQEAQEKILDTLLKEYSKTEYGTSFHSAEISGIPQYQLSFPIANYQQLTMWYQFWAAIVILIGVSIIARSAVLFAANQLRKR